MPNKSEATVVRLLYLATSQEFIRRYSCYKNFNVIRIAFRHSGFGLKYVCSTCSNAPNTCQEDFLLEYTQIFHSGKQIQAFRLRIQVK